MSRPAGSPNGPASTTLSSTVSSPRAWVCAASLVTWAGDGTPSSGTPAPLAGRTWSRARKRQLSSKLDPFKPYLAHRWAETGGNVTILDLHREISARGFRGHYTLVHSWIRRELPRQKGVTPAPPPPSIRQVTGWLTRHPATLTEEEKLHRKAVLGRYPELACAAELTSSFAEMLTTLSGTRLPEWINEATDAGLPGISGFATGLNNDLAAVTAGLTTDWNSGPVEGAVNRIKMLKRQMFGRAGFRLLRKRVLLA